MNKTTKPTYIIAIAPKQISKLRNFFRSGPDSVIEIMNNPGYLRETGWNLPQRDEPRIMKGEYIEAGYPDWKLIKVFEDGTVILKVAVDDNLIYWGHNQSPRINSLALIELTYNFVDFYKKLITKFTEVTSDFTIRTELNNLFLTNDNPLYLLPGAIGDTYWLFNSEHDRHRAPENKMQKELVVSGVDIKDKSCFVGYQIIEKIYAWFGLSSDDIPYVDKTSCTEPLIDIEQIKKN